MRYVLSVLLLIALLPAALAQDKEAEKLFRGMEKKIKAANAVQITVAIEIGAIKGSDNENKLKDKVSKANDKVSKANDKVSKANDKIAALVKAQEEFKKKDEDRLKDKEFKANGFLLLTKDNKVQLKIRGGNVGMEMVSNGKQLTLANEERLLSDDAAGAAKPMPAPKYLHGLLSTLVSRAGVTAGSMIILFAPGPQFDLVMLKLGEFDPDKLRLGVVDFKAGAADKVGGRDAKVIRYRFPGGLGRETQTLWLDNKTLLPLKRVYTLENMHITEIYTEFNLDPKIDAKAFELIPTPNEAEKLFRAMVEKIKAAQAVQVTFHCEGKGKEQGKDVEAKARGSLLFTKDNKARLVMSTNETGKEVTIEAISDGKRWKMAESPATVAKAEAEPTRKDLHSMLSTKWTEVGFFSINYLFNAGASAGPKCRLADFGAGAAEKVGGRDAKVVTYSVLSLGPVGQVTFWIDAETLLPLKRVIATEAARGTEIYNFNLNPKVDAGTFTLPK